MTFAVHADPCCLRGLRFVYAAPGLVEDRLVARIRGAFPDHLLEGHERWGEITVQRLIVQFRFELQLGARPGEVALLHRVTATADQRAADRARFEAELAAALEPS
jgi:hypothetical protein